MKKISKIKEYAARYLYEVLHMELSTIAKEIDVTQKTLSEILNIPENNNQANIKTASSKTSSFITQTAVKGTKNVTIMTQGASQIGDETKNKSNKKFESSIYRPRG